MGGMGTIHSANDFAIYSENHAMTMNILSTAIDAGVKRFLWCRSVRDRYFGIVAVPAPPPAKSIS
jgi:hypothetical protein